MDLVIFFIFSSYRSTAITWPAATNTAIGPILPSIAKVDLVIFSNFSSYQSTAITWPAATNTAIGPILSSIAKVDPATNYISHRHSQLKTRLG